jgi:glutathione-regulated potassium-efflux system protein KefB
VIANWQIIAASVAAYMVVKGGRSMLVARVLKSGHAEALERAMLMAQGGEFAFVLYTDGGVGTGIIDGPTNAIFTATVIISMVLTPLAIIALRALTAENRGVARRRRGNSPTGLSGAC